MDKMPDEVYVLKQWGGVVGFEPFAGAEKYRRADLPKEVDVKPLKLIPTEYSTGVRSFYEEGWNDCLDHLVALGVIKDKGV